MRTYRHLTAEERDVIASMRAEGFSLQAIACKLKRAASTISRELRRFLGPQEPWRPDRAEAGYRWRRRRAAVLETDARLAAYVHARLVEGWSPEQIAGRLKLGLEPGLRAICAETIYAWIYRAGQKARKLWNLLARRRARRRRRGGRAWREIVTEKVQISERSAAADARAELGHWEADLLLCRRRPLLVVHERKTRLTLISRLADKGAAATALALLALLRPLAAPLRASVTFDNDSCFARHVWLRPWLSATTYFCDTYASWQKGGVENANGRLRRWLPKGCDLDAVADAELDEIALALNLTPRKCLGYLTPIEAVTKELGKPARMRFA
jgi:transposase, IS30 family